MDKLGFPILFQVIISDPNNVLRKHFPDIKRYNYNLRPRAHGFILPLKEERNFIPRLLFRTLVYEPGSLYWFGFLLEDAQAVVTKLDKADLIDLIICHSS